MNLRRALLLATLLATVASSGALAAINPVAPELEARFETGFTPTALSKSEQTPLSLRVGLGFRLADGSRVPALKEFEFDGDRHMQLNLGGVPVCTPSRTLEESQLQARCSAALVGRGQINLTFAFPETTTGPVKAPITAYRGPVEGGARTLLLVFYVTIPTPAVYISKVSIKKALTV